MYHAFEKGMIALACSFWVAVDAVCKIFLDVVGSKIG